jgi:hypothetical protein
MTSRDLTREQLEALGAVIGRQLNYLGRLQRRMEQLPIPTKLTRDCRGRGMIKWRNELARASPGG